MLLILTPYIYAILCILLPIYLFDMNYMMTNLTLFWIPVLILYPLIRPNTKAFLLLLLIFYPLSVAWEFLGLYFDIWNFSEAHHKLLGWNLFGVPVEEFVFWFGASPFVVLVYLWFKKCNTKKTN